MHNLKSNTKGFFWGLILFMSVHYYGEQQQTYKETKTFDAKCLMLTTLEQMQNISLK